MTAAQQAFGTTQQFLGLQMGFFGLDLAHIVMLAVGAGFIFLAIKKEWEPYELLPIGAGMILANLPFTGLMTEPAAGQAAGQAGYWGSSSNTASTSGPSCPSSSSSGSGP